MQFGTWLRLQNKERSSRLEGGKKKKKTLGSRVTPCIAPMRICLPWIRPQCPLRCRKFST
jgi:hypothetical protein